MKTLLQWTSLCRYYKGRFVEATVENQRIRIDGKRDGHRAIDRWTAIDKQTIDGQQDGPSSVKSITRHQKQGKQKGRERMREKEEEKPNSDDRNTHTIWIIIVMWKMSVVTISVVIQGKDRQTGRERGTRRQKERRKEKLWGKKEG